MGFWVFFTDDREEYYDSDACELYLSPDRIIEITGQSKTIFDYLIVNRNNVKSRTQITSKIDGVEERYIKNDINDKSSDRSSVDFAISTLRKKLEKYRDCIKTVRNVGYKYIGPPKEDKNTSALIEDGQVLLSNINNVSSTKSVDNNSETVRVRSKKSRINLKIHSQSIWGVNNIKTALGLLVEANDIRQIKLSRSQIYRAIDMFFRSIETPYSKNIIDYNDIIWEEYEKDFFQIVFNCMEEIEISDQSSELIDIKLQLLQNIMEWRFLMIMLRTQLDLERQAFEMSADLIDKEIRQTKVNKLDEDYQITRENAEMAETMLDEMINEYDHDLSATK